MNWIPREECLQLHNAVGGKICRTLSFAVYNSTTSLHQLRSEDIFQTELAGLFHAMQKSGFSYALSLKIRARETIPMSTRNFPPRHQVSSGAQVMPSAPECALDKQMESLK